MPRLLGLLVLVAGAAGCGAQPYLLGTRGSHLFTARDAIALTGQPVKLTARLQGGDFLLDLPGYVVRFHRDGRLFKAAQTDEEGVATVTFTPPAPGDYRFRAEVASTGFADEPPRPQELLVACRRPDAPLAVVDLDKTLVAGGFQTVLVGDPNPMPGSVEVMRRLARDHTIVYLTHRPDYFSNKSKGWLAGRGYPRGPVLLSSVSGFLKGSGAYKTEVLRRLRDRFSGLRVGIGDKVSDALAYHETGLKSILIVQMPAGEDPQDYTALASALGRLPQDVQAVTDWREVGRTLFERASFPAGRLIDRLERKARELEAEREAGRAGGGAP